MAFVQLHLLRTHKTAQRIVLTFAHADLTVPDVNVVLMDVEVLVVLALLEELVQELENVCVTETVSERNVEMTVVTLVISVISVDLLKFVVLTSDVLEPVHPTAETLMDPKEFVVTTDASVLAVNVLKLLDKTTDAETDNVFANPNVTSTLVDLMVAVEPVDPVPEMLHVSTELVSSQFWAVVEMVSAHLN